MALKSDVNFEEKLTCGLKNDIRNLANFHWSTWKCRKCMSVKFTEELYDMTMKNDAKFEEEFVILKLTWGTWTILTQTLKNLKNLLFN